MEHIDHSLVVVQGGGASDINGTYNKFSTHRDGPYQYAKDGPGPNKKKYSKIVHKEGQLCITYQQHVLYTNENSLGNEPPRDGFSVVTRKGKEPAPICVLGGLQDNTFLLMLEIMILIYWMMPTMLIRPSIPMRQMGQLLMIQPVKPMKLTRRTRVKMNTYATGPM